MCGLASCSLHERGKSYIYMIYIPAPFTERNIEFGTPTSELLNRLYFCSATRLWRMCWVLWHNGRLGPQKVSAQRHFCCSSCGSSESHQLFLRPHILFGTAEFAQALLGSSLGCTPPSVVHISSDFGVEHHAQGGRRIWGFA